MYSLKTVIFLFFFYVLMYTDKNDLAQNILKLVPFNQIQFPKLSYLGTSIIAQEM